jgi:DNA-binding transcriptional LysR family regulator
VAKKLSPYSKLNTRWDDYQLFLAIYEARSLSAAAARLNLSQPTFSRRLAQLEEAMGRPLFRRLPTGVTPTALAEKLVAGARHMAETAAELDRLCAQSPAALGGVVRITAPPGWAYGFLPAFAAKVKARHPDIVIEALSSIARLDLVRGEADLAIRTQRSTSPDLTSLGHFRFANTVCAAPSYVARLPKAPSWSDLDWIVWAPPYEHLPPNPQLEAGIPHFVPAFSSDDFIVRQRAAELGLGVMVMPRAMHAFSKQTTLKPIPFDLGAFATSDIHILCARTSLTIERIRVVAALLTDTLRAHADSD